MSAPIGVFCCVFLLSVVQKLTPKIVRLILRYWKQQSEDESKKHQELTELRRQLNLISAKDEFAKYARTQRKINKLTDEMSQINKSKSVAMVKYQWMVTAVLYTIQVLLYLSLIWTYYNQPLVKLDPDWLFPMTTIVSIPTGIPGGVGITCWLVTCNKVSTILIDTMGQAVKPL
ncbi:guided entry of tail-anchored proteins factor 1-like [Ptychodera flava]|uniref:guided entry of tail-anchored proteins factor 1-like n=1 Tax=Ptychodera flava TaxID=63121 RepID=UPI00396A1888